MLYKLAQDSLVLEEALNERDGRKFNNQVEKMGRTEYKGVVPITVAREYLMEVAGWKRREMSEEEMFTPEQVKEMYMKRTGKRMPETMYEGMKMKRRRKR